MPDLHNPDENPSHDEPEVSKVYPLNEDGDSAGLPDLDFLGLTPGDANDETKPGDPPVPDQA